MFNPKSLKILSIISTIVGIGAQLLTSFVGKKELKQTVAEEVAKQIPRKCD